MTDMSTSPTLSDRAWDLTRRALKKIGLEPKPKFDPLQPFGPRPRAPRDTYQTLPTVALSRIHFAFLDGAHTEQDVLDEFAHVQPRQQPGDVIVFDDVTESAFPGIVAAMKTIEARGDYAVEYLSVDENRGYAIAQRL